MCLTELSPRSEGSLHTFSSATEVLLSVGRGYRSKSLLEEGSFLHVEGGRTGAMSVEKETNLPTSVTSVSAIDTDINITGSATGQTANNDREHRTRESQASHAPGDKDVPPGYAHRQVRTWFEGLSPTDRMAAASLTDEAFLATIAEVVSSAAPESAKGRQGTFGSMHVRDQFESTTFLSHTFSACYSLNRGHCLLGSACFVRVSPTNLRISSQSTCGVQRQDERLREEPPREVEDE